MSIKVHVRYKGDHRNLWLWYIDPDTGRERGKSAETKDLRKADQAAARWEDELNEFRGVNDDGWEHFRERFRTEHLAHLATKSYKSFTTALNHYDRLFSPRTVADVTASTLSQFRAKLVAEDRPPASVANYMTHLRTALNWAERVGMIQKAPAVMMPRGSRLKFARARPVTEDEYRAMLQACEKVCPDDAASWRRLLELLWLSGLRLGEALKLSWDSPPIVVKLDAKPYPLILFYAEGHKARRDDAVPMTPELAAWLKQTPPEARSGRVAPVPLATQSRVSKTITSIGHEAKVIVSADGKFASAHDLRRSFATRWAQKVMPMTLQKLMRHADISTTLKYYVGLTSDDAGRELWSVPASVPEKASERQKAG